jgi:hypothetical protein
MVTKKSPDSIKHLFFCEFCNYKCSKNSEYIKHLLTRKHNSNAAGNKKISENKYVCVSCNKPYKSRKGLWSHTKICNYTDDSEKTIDNSDMEVKSLSILVVELIKSNQELQKQVLELCKTNNININSNNNSHNNNKTFNLQFFLNEECKDAMNIMDFVESFTLQLSDLESVSKQGYVDGISNIIMKKLNEMDIHKRPIHCSDAKREIMYVKDQDQWAKEEPGYAKLRKAIKYISKKNSDLLFQWSDAHPASKNVTSQTNTEYMQMILQAMGGRGEIGDNENKIIKKIAKTVLIEKI